MTLSTAETLNTLQLGNNSAYRQVGVERRHKVDEIVTLEACSDILVSGRKLDFPKGLHELMRCQ
jgi:hypothetical protein